MNEKIKATSLELLEEVQEMANCIDVESNKEDICTQLDEITRLIEKVKTGISKII